MRLCKDCVYFRPLVSGWWIFKIHGPEHLSRCAESLEPVSGNPAEFCEFKRKATGMCGPEGMLFVRSVASGKQGD